MPIGKSKNETTVNSVRNLCGCVRMCVCERAVIVCAVNNLISLHCDMKRIQWGSFGAGKCEEAVLEKCLD